VTPPEQQDRPDREVVVDQTPDRPAKPGQVPAPGAFGRTSAPGPTRGQGSVGAPAGKSSDSSDGGSDSGSGWRWVTRILIVSVLAGSAYLLLFENPQRCGQQLSDAGQAVRVCAPLEVTSPQALLVLLVIGLLLLPELAEIEIGGVLTLRRAVAEAKGEATQARTEAAEARLASAQLAAQVTQLTAHTASAAAATSTTNIYLEQARQTAEAQAQLQSEVPSQPSAAVTTTPGQSSLVAFTAGLVGLAHSLPRLDEGVGVAVVGTTLTEDGLALEATHDPFDVEQHLLELAERLLNGTDLRPGEVVAAFEPGALVVASLAAIDGEVVGGLAAVLRPRPSVEATAGDQHLDEFYAAVRIAAGAYAQLLVDLLGEQPTERW
jgi:hypothetical protein